MSVKKETFKSFGDCFHIEIQYSGCQDIQI